MQSLWLAGKKYSHRKHFPRPEDFAKAIYTMDIGQNDVAAAIEKGGVTEGFQAVASDIVQQFATQVQVSDVIGRGIIYLFQKIFDFLKFNEI